MGLLVEVEEVVYDSLSPGLSWDAESCGDAALGWQESNLVDELRPLEDQVREVFLALREPVYRYLYSTLGNRADAEDLTQETFTRLYHRVSRGDAIENYRAWVFRVAHNLAVDSWKSARRDGADPLVLDAARLQSSDPGVEADILERERISARQARISSALKRLSPQERQCLELRAEGLRYREIAEVLGVQVPTVQTFLTRAIAKMAGSEGRR